MHQSIVNLKLAYDNFFKNDELNLTKTIKELKFECSKRDRSYLYNNKNSINSITLSGTKTGKYFAYILIDSEFDRTMPEPINNVISIDLGIKTFATLSNGAIVENPKWIRASERKLRKLQRQLIKKKEGGKNWEKIRIRLALAHEKINRS